MTPDDTRPEVTGGGRVVTIRCRFDGPLVVEVSESPAGSHSHIQILVIDHLGNPFALPTKKLLALCRCGQTITRPFCDGSHKICGFEAADLAAG